MAASAVVVKILQRRQHVDVLSLAAWQMLYGSIPLVVIAFFTYSGAPVWTAPIFIAIFAPFLDPQRDFEVGNYVTELTAQDCEYGGWKQFGFTSQGQCINYVNSD